MNSLIQVRNLCKDFGEKSVLNHVSLEVCEGEIIGLLGANGAGKTTLSSHILSEILQTAESVVIIANGNLQQLGTIDELKEQHRVTTIRSITLLSNCFVKSSKTVAICRHQCSVIARQVEGLTAQYVEVL